VKLFGKSGKIIQRILIVEDEPLVAFDNEHFLIEAGYEVVATVDELADARRVLDEERVDLVLCDLRLRGEGDGTDVAHYADRKNIPVLYVTGFKPPETGGAAVGCLAKPYTAKMLLSALTTLESHLVGKKVKRLPPGLTLYRQPNGALPG
jgi:CheY-like chemotaxis protein